jgi:hypothetical protein
MPTAQELLAENIAAAVVMRQEGDHAGAAMAFVKLGGGVESVSRRRAANLYAQAALSFAQAGRSTELILCARKALQMFGDLDLYTRATSFYSGLLKQLEAATSTKTLDAYRTEFSHKAVIMQGEAKKENLPTHALPAVCPACTLPMRFDEVDWISATRAECDYCGIVVNAG